MTPSSLTNSYIYNTHVARPIHMYLAYLTMSLRETTHSQDVIAKGPQ